MGTVYAVQTTLNRAGVAPADLVKRQLWGGGQFMHFTDYYEAASLASGSIIKFGPFPKGAVLVPQLSRIVHDALGTAVTLAVGDDDPGGTADADRYLEAAASASAATKPLTDVACINKVPYQLLDAWYLTITTGGATATGTIKVDLVLAI